MFSKNHPEIREGEIFLGNATLQEAAQWLYRSKRIGKAFDCDGNPLNCGTVAVFVSELEYRKKCLAAGVSPDL